MDRVFTLQEMLVTPMDILILILMEKKGCT